MRIPIFQTHQNFSFQIKELGQYYCTVSYISKYDGEKTTTKYIFLKCIKQYPCLSVIWKRWVLWYVRQRCDTWAPILPVAKQCSSWIRNFPSLLFTVSVICNLSTVKCGCGDPLRMPLLTCIHFTQKCSLNPCLCPQTLFSFQSRDSLYCRVV